MSIQIFIFIMGIIVSVMVISGLYALVPKQMRPPEEVYYRKTGEKEGVKI